MRLDFKVGVGQSFVETAYTTITAQHFSDPSRGNSPFVILYLSNLNLMT